MIQRLNAIIRNRSDVLPPWVPVAVLLAALAVVGFALWKQTNPTGGDMALPKEEVARRLQKLYSHMHAPGAGNGPDGSMRLPGAGNGPAIPLAPEH